MATPAAPRAPTPTPTTRDYVLQGTAVFLVDESPFPAKLWALAHVPIVVEPGVGVTFKMPPGTRVVRTECTTFAARTPPVGEETTGMTVDMRALAVCEADVELVKAQVVVDRDEVTDEVIVNTLLAHKGDIVEAIMALTM